MKKSKRKFSVEVSRVCAFREVACLDIEATSKRAARRQARQRMKEGEVDFRPSDFEDLAEVLSVDSVDETN